MKKLHLYVKTMKMYNGGTVPRTRGCWSTILVRLGVPNLIVHFFFGGEHPPLLRDGVRTPSIMYTVHLWYIFPAAPRPGPQALGAGSQTPGPKTWAPGPRPTPGPMPGPRDPRPWPHALSLGPHAPCPGPHAQRPGPRAPRTRHRAPAAFPPPPQK